MEDDAGIEVSLEQSRVCVVDGAGKIVREAKVASEAEALIRFFSQLGRRVRRIGQEAGPLSQWLQGGLILQPSFFCDRLDGHGGFCHGCNG